MIKSNNSLTSARILTSFSRRGLDCAVNTATFPVSPVAQRLPYIYHPVFEVAHTAHTRHRQNQLVCATLLLMISFCYALLAQWHRQNAIYRTCARARAVKSSHSLIYLSYFKRKRLCHCASPMLTLVCVCATRMCPYVSSVPPNFEVNYGF